VAATTTRPLISSGEFARRTRLSSKALRIYHRVGLLPPVAIESNGYRRYDPAQVRTGQLIGMLRGAGLGLAEIGVVLERLDDDVESAVDQLERMLADRERQHATEKLLIRHVQVTLRTGEDAMFPIRTRHVPARRVMSIQRRLYAHETDAFAREAKTAFLAHLGEAVPPGPFMLIFHGVVSHDSDGPLEAVLPCPQDLQPSELIGVRTEPAHDEAYTTITKAQWAYPAILAAYDAVACSPEVLARSRSRLSCREVYIAAPDRIEDDDLICDVAFPVGPPKESEPVVERVDVPVMFKRATDDQASITRAWTELEEAIGSLRGRKFYGVFDPRSNEYRACVELRGGDDPQALGLELGTLPGGRYARLRLTGEPPGVYARILPESKRLAQRPDADPWAPSIEFYRRRDVIDLLQRLR
jgi:DNA-binding transcriptional MerR regulator